MAMLHPVHLALIAVAVLLVFGPRKLPELARGIGESMKELKRSLHAEPEAELAEPAGEVVAQQGPSR